MVCKLRSLVYSLGINNAPRISFTLIKSRVKNLRRFKQPVCRCKMACAWFHSIAKLRAQIFNPVLADHGVYSADYHNENDHTADCQSQESEFESGLPQTWTLRMVRIRPQSGSWQSAVHCKAVCQGDIIVMANRSIRARELAKEWNPTPTIFAIVFSYHCAGETEKPLIMKWNLFSLHWLWNAQK
jgi:hypothetical protein